MEIGVISDTHDNVPNLLKAITIFNKQKVGLVIHCGDWVSPYMCDFCRGLRCRMISVFGNNEGYIFGFLSKAVTRKWNIEFIQTCATLRIGRRSIAVYHGDTEPLLEALIVSQKYDAVFSGDTHIRCVKRHGRTLHVNPGTTCGEQDSKITEKSTIAIYNTTDNSARIISF
jgi:uncharacterized protein